ncbi:MAG: acyl-CoA thioesterase [Fibrobacteraceae bacterium]|nr:acyl-CoA thioesterase [Fibrobacteraceae bacterium]
MEIAVSPLDHTARIEVRYAETDAMAIVHHAVYPVWFEQARTEIMRVHGVPFSEIEDAGYHSPLLSLEVEYIKPCRYGDFADVHVTFGRIDRLRFKFFYEVTVNGELRTKGSTTHIFTYHDKPCRELPPKLMKTFFNSEPKA